MISSKYQLLFCVAFATIYVAWQFPQQTPLIVGGGNISIEEVPYQISLEDNGSHFCGGLIISPVYIVTAAHCIDGMNDTSTLRVRAGTSTLQSGGQVATVTALYSNPKFEYKTKDYDIGILKLAPPLTLDVSVNPITLPEEGQTWPVGTDVFVSGWGITSENNVTSPTYLQGVTVQLISSKDCANDYEGFVVITERMICASVKGGGKDSCQGDSGGPLVANGILVGVVSWGIGCARVGNPGVYTNVATLRRFIKEVTGL